MGIDLRGTHIGMTQQRLYGAYVAATPEQLGGKSMPEGMATGGLADTRATQSLLDRFLYGGHVNVMTHDLTILVRAQAVGGKQPLPFERARRARVLAAQRKRQADRCLEKGLMAFLGLEDVLLALQQTADQGRGQQGGAVLATLTVMHGDHLPVEIEVLDPQARCLDYPEASSIH